jgi:hypothetical protein
VLNNPTVYTDPSGFAQVRMYDLPSNMSSGFGGFGAGAFGRDGWSLSEMALSAIPSLPSGGVDSDCGNGIYCGDPCPFCIEGGGSTPGTGDGDGATATDLGRVVITVRRSLEGNVIERAVDAYVGPRIFDPEHMARMERLTRDLDNAKRRGDDRAAWDAALEAAGALGVRALTGQKGQKGSQKGTQKQPGKPTPSKKHVRDMSVDERREHYRAQGYSDAQLGPSGYPKLHNADHSRRKEAVDAARHEGQGPPMHHPHSVNRPQPPHYHSTDSAGNKLESPYKPNVHHNYPP